MVPVNTSKRTFLPQNLDFSQWQNLQPYYDKVEKETIRTKEELKAWLKHWDELSKAVDDYKVRLSIYTTINTNDEDTAKAYDEFMTQLQPRISAYENKFQLKLTESPFFEQIDDENFFPAFRQIKSDLKKYSAENDTLLGEEKILENEYTQIIGAQTFDYGGKQLPLDSLRVLLEDTNRARREQVFQIASKTTLQDSEKLDDLLSKLISLRHEIAKNAGFDNYISYKFAEWGRFDYSINDCRQMYKSIADIVVPLKTPITEERKRFLQLDVLRPWDHQVPLNDRPPLKPSENSEELLNKTIQCLYQLDEYFGAGLARLKEIGHFDLEPRLNKFKGGAYSCYLPETEVPFIFHNNNNTANDLTVLIHEGGHAIHSLLCTDMEYSLWKYAPLEIAEVASKAMELMSMEYWGIFYPNPEDLKQSKKAKLQDIIHGLCSCAESETFQFWMYENPTHSAEERHDKFTEYWKQYRSALTDYSGYENILNSAFQGNMAVYTVPLYDAAYCFSDFGAIALWRNYKKDSGLALKQYKTALSLGNTRTVPELYKAAGIEFNSSPEYIRELMDFLKQQIAELE